MGLSDERWIWSGLKGLNRAEVAVTGGSGDRERLVEQARDEGVDLVGPRGLSGELTEQVFATGLEVETEEHLGYEKYSAEGQDGGNSRNGTRSKKVITEVGPVEIDSRRDRDGSSSPRP